MNSSRRMANSRLQISPIETTVSALGFPLNHSRAFTMPGHFASSGSRQQTCLPDLRGFFCPSI